jgi:hypothetical protein
VSLFSLFVPQRIILENFGIGGLPDGDGGSYK